MQYLPLQFFDADDFKATNVKFPLDIALAFFNANALKERDYAFISYGGSNVKPILTFKSNELIFEE